MQAALDYFATPTTTPLYSEIFFNRQYRFQYPPSALFALQGMQWLAPGNVRTNETQTFPTVTLNDIIGWVFLLATGLATAALLELQIRKRYAADSRVLLAARVAIAAGFTLTFYPIVKAYTLGQLQVWINGLFAVALLCWATGWKSVSGFLIGLTCLMKPHYGLFLPWALLRGGMALPGRVRAPRVAAGLAASVLVFGFANHIDYLRVVSFLSRAGRGLLPESLDQRPAQPHHGHRRPRRNTSNLEFVAGQFPPFNPLGLRHHPGRARSRSLAAALLHRSTPGRFRPPVRLLPYGAELHHGLAHRLGAPLRHPAADLRRAGRSGRRARPLPLGLLAAAYALASVYIPATMLLAPTPFNFAQSYLLFAALIVLALLHWRPWADRDAQASMAVTRKRGSIAGAPSLALPERKEDRSKREQRYRI